MLLLLFDSKAGLVRALLSRARSDETSALDRLRTTSGGQDPRQAAEVVWGRLAAPGHRPLLTLWLEAYARTGGTGRSLGGIRRADGA